MDIFFHRASHNRCTCGFTDGGLCVVAVVSDADFQRGANGRGYFAYGPGDEADYDAGQNGEGVWREHDRDMATASTVCRSARADAFRASADPFDVRRSVRRTGVFLRLDAGKAAEDGCSGPPCGRTDARYCKPHASRRGNRRHRGARAHCAADAQCRQHGFRCRHRGRRCRARGHCARCRRRDCDVQLRATAGRRSAPAAHRVHRADQQIRPRILLRRLPDRSRHQALAHQQARAVGCAADFSVLGRACLQGEFCA